MGTTINGVYEGGKRLRRVKALKRLEAQLVSNKKPLESARLQAGEKVMSELTSQDITRIEKEIAILKSKI